MLIRLMIACGMLGVACPVSAQVYDNGHRSPIYDGHSVPYYGGHHYYGHSGHTLHPHTYQYEYHSSHAPLTNQYGMVPGHRAFGYGDFASGHDAPTAQFDSFPRSYQCPFQNGHDFADSPQQYEEYGNRQYGSSPSHGGHVHDGHEGHSHDHSHAHEDSRSAAPPRGDVGRLQEFPPDQVPFRDQVAPRMRTLVPSDRQLVAPPALPPSSLSRPPRPEQFETPLGDGPPPNTVPLSSPTGAPDRNAEPTTLNF